MPLSADLARFTEEKVVRSNDRWSKIAYLQIGLVTHTRFEVMCRFGFGLRLPRQMQIPSQP